MLRKKGKTKQKEGPIQLVENDPIVLEQLKIVRTNIEFASIDDKIKTLAITSVNAGAGKSTITANLSRSFAFQNKKVLIIDADLRRPTIHKAFSLNNNKGLSSLLSDSTLTIDEAIQRSEDSNLYILTSGPIPPNPSEMLSSKKMEAIIEEGIARFDLIVFDLPPFNLVADAQIISNKVDATIFVLRKGVDSKVQIKKCKSSLESSNANVIGAIFNHEKIDRKHHYYYH